jgi:L-malate glycosyltransferase
MFRDTSREANACRRDVAATLNDDPRPWICILDGGVDRTGGLVAARREAALLADEARFLLVLPTKSGVRNIDLPEFDRVERLPVAILRKSASSLLTYGPTLLVGGWRLRKLLERQGCSRLQVNDFYLAPAFFARILGFRGIIATWLRIDPRRFGVAGRVWLALASRFSDRLVVVSRTVRGQAPQWSEVALIYDPAPLLGDTGPPQGGRFVFLGNYIDGKGQDLAIRAFHRLAESRPDGELVFHGGTMGLDKNRAYLERLKAAATAGPGAARIRFEGPADGPGEVYAAALAALNFSRSESFSLTCQEASAAGLPVIATRSGGPEEIIEDGRTGFLVEHDNIEAMAERMAWLLDHPDDARVMGEAGRKRVADLFSPQSAASALREIFNLSYPDSHNRQ